MYCRVHRPVNTPGVSDNKGTCRQLVDYLSKESQQERPYYDSFFSQVSDFVSARQVRVDMDNNHRTLKRADDKFYMLTINPDRKELSHLARIVTGKEVDEFSALDAPEQEKVLAEMKNYARGCMDEYARNFYREKVRDGHDLVWYGRVETERHYKEGDKDVQEGRAKAGDRKPGLQLHVHVIVSRMDKTQTVSLSPLSKSRGNRQKLDGRDVIVGFDRSEWASRCASHFMQRYGYTCYARTEAGAALQKQERRWHTRNMAGNKAISAIKRELLHGELREERKLLGNMVRAYRFIVNPRKAILAELKQAGKHLLE